MIIAKAPGIVAYPALANANATTVSGTGTTAMVFPTNVNTTQLPSGSALILSAPGSNRLEGCVFYVSASGVFRTGAATTTVTPAILAAIATPALASQLTPGSYTTMAAPTGVSIASAGTYPWFIEAELIADSASGILHGNMRTVINNALTGPVALSSTLTSVNLATEAPLIFVPAFTFSVSNANNYAQVDRFYLSAD